MHLNKSIFVPIAVAAILASSGDLACAQTPPAESQFVVLHSGADGNSPRKRLKLIKAQSEYEAELAAHTNGRGTPAILNFSAGRVLLADMGSRNSGGFSVEVTSIDVNDTYVVANIRLNKPGTNCIVTQAITSPYQFVYIPSVKEILFKETVTVVNC